MPLGRKTPIGKPGWGSMLGVLDGGLTSIPWEDLDPTLVLKRYEVLHPYPLPSLWRSSPGQIRNVPVDATAS